MNLPMSFLSRKFIPRMEDVAGAANITAATIQHPFSKAHRARYRQPGAIAITAYKPTSKD